MPTLYHLPLSPDCRKVRIMLAEKAVEVALLEERTWERRHGFLTLNPAGEVPVLVEADGTAIAGAMVICEYLDEIHPQQPLIGVTPGERAEVRRLTAWFSGKFAAEVTCNLVDEKITKRLTGVGEPNSTAIRAGLANIHAHLDYISFLADHRRWLAGDLFSLADIAAAAQLSCVDYLGNVPWDRHEGARDWYARIKSRPSFRPILADRLPGLPPPDAYANLDF